MPARNAGWGTVQNYGVSPPLIFSLSQKWQGIVTPTVQYSGENGANWGSAIIYGGLGSVNFNWGKAGYLNLGAVPSQFRAYPWQLRKFKNFL